MKWFSPDWSWLLPARRSREKRKPVRPQFELLEDRWLFNANPLIPRPLNPLEGVPASNNDWLASLYSTGAVSPMVPGTFANFGFGGNYTLTAEGTYDLEIHIYGSDFSGSFSFDATGSVAYDLLQQGGNANGLYGVSTFSLDQSATVSFHYHDSGTLLDPPRDISANPTVDVHDPGDFTFLPDNRHWHIFNWYSIVGDIDDIYELGMFDRNWGTLTVTESGTHSHTLTDPTSTSFTYSGTNLINNSITGDNLSETLNEYRSGNMTFTEHGEGTFTLSEAGGKSGLPNLSFSYSESGATTYSLIQATTETHTATAYGNSLSNSIRSADSVGGMTTTLSWDYEATLDSTHRQSGTTTYVLNEEGGYGSGLAFSLLYRHQEGNGTFNFEQTGSRSDNRSHSIRTHADGRDNLGSAFNSTDSFAADSSDSYTDSGTVQTAYSQSGSVSFTLEQTGDNPIGLYQFSVISYTQNSNSTFTFSETTDFTRGGAATLTLRQDSTDSTTLAVAQEVGYDSLGSYGQRGTDSYAYASSETSAYSGPTDSTITQEGTLSSTLYQAGSMSMTSPYASTSFVLDQQGTSSFTRDEHSYPEQSGLGTITRRDGGLGSFNSAGSASYNYAAMAGGFSSAGSFGHLGNEQESTVRLFQSNYTFNGVGTITLHRTGNTSFTQHETGVPSPSAFRIDQDSTGTYSNHQEETRTVQAAGLAVLTYVSTSVDTASYQRGGGPSFTQTGRARRDSGSNLGNGLQAFAASDTSTSNLGGNASSIRSELGSTSFTLHLEGTRLSGTLSLSSCTLRHGNDGTFSVGQLDRQTYDGSGRATQSDSGSSLNSTTGNFMANSTGLFGNSATESYGLGGTNSSQVGGFRSFAADVITIYSFTGGATVTQSRDGHTSLTVYQAGAYSQGSYSLSSYSFRQGSDGTFVLRHETNRSTTGTETTTYLEEGNGTFNADVTGLSSTRGTNTPAGYGGTTTAAVLQGGSSSGDDDSTLTVRRVDVVPFGETTTYTRNDRGSESFTELRVGSYNQGSFSYGLLRTEQGSDGTYTQLNSTLHGWDGVSNGTFIQNSIRSGDGSSTDTVSSSGFDRFGSTTFTNAPSSLGSSSHIQLTNSFTNGTFQKTLRGVDNATLDSSGQLIQHALREGSYAAGQVSLNCLTVDRTDQGTFSNSTLRSQTDEGWLRQSTEAGGGRTFAGSGTDSFVFGSDVYQSAGNPISEFSTNTQAATSSNSGTGNFGGGDSFAFDSVSSYSFSSVATISKDETGRQTFSQHQEGTSVNGLVNLSSFVLNQQSSSLFTGTENRRQRVFDGYESFTSSQNGIGLQTSSQAGTGSTDDSTALRLSGTSTGTSASTAGSGYSATGDAGVLGTSAFNLSGTSTVGNTASSTGHTGSIGSTSANGNSSYQLYGSGVSSFGSDSYFTFGQSGQSSFSLYQAGSYSSGNLGVSSYARREGSSGTSTRHEWSLQSVTALGTSTRQQAGTSIGNFGSLDSATGSDQGTWAFSNRTVASLGQGSGVGLNSFVSSSQSTYGYTRNSLDTTTYDEDTSSSYGLEQVGRYGNGSFNLSRVLYDSTSNVSFQLVQNSHRSEDGTIQSRDTTGAADSFSESGTDSQSLDMQDTYGVGATEASRTVQLGGGSGAGTGSASSLLSQSFRQVQTIDVSNRQHGESTATEHLEGRYGNGSLTLDVASTTQDNHSRGTFSQTSSTDILDGHSLSCFQQSDTRTGSSSGSSTLGSVGTSSSTNLFRSGTDSVAYIGSYSFSQSGLSSHAFSSHDTFTRDQSSFNTYNLAQVGSYSHGSMSLASFTLRNSAWMSYTQEERTSRSVQDGFALDSSTSSGQATQTSVNLSNATYSSSGTAGAARQFATDQNGTDTVTQSALQSTNFFSTSLVTVTVSGITSSGLVQQGRFSLNSFALDSYSLDRHEDATTTQQLFSTDGRDGSALSSVTRLRAGRGNSLASSQYQGADTGAENDHSSANTTLTQTDSSTFTSLVTVTRVDWSLQSVTDHRVGAFSNGSLSLSCYSLGQAGQQSYTDARRSTSGSTGSMQSSETAAGADSFTEEAASNSYQYGSEGTFADSNLVSYGYSSRQTFASDANGQSSFTLGQLGRHGNASWALDSISYREGSIGSFASNQSMSQSRSGPNASGSETAGRFDGGLQTMSLSQLGRYSGASLTLEDHRFEQQSASSYTSQEQGDPSWGTGSQSYTRDGTGSQSSRQYEQGGYAAGRFNLSCYSLDQSSQDSFTSRESGMQSTTTARSNCTWSSGSVGSASLHRLGRYGAGSFQLDESRDTSSGSSSYSRTETGYQSAGSFAGSYWREESGANSYSLYEMGVYSGQSLSVSSYTWVSDSTSSYEQQRLLNAAVPDYLRAEGLDQTVHERLYGSGDLGSYTRSEELSWMSRGQGAGLGGFASAFDDFDEQNQEESRSEALPRDIGQLPLSQSLPPVKDNASDLSANLTDITGALVGLQGDVLGLVRQTKTLEFKEPRATHEILEAPAALREGREVSGGPLDTQAQRVGGVYPLAGPQDVLSGASAGAGTGNTRQGPALTGGSGLMDSFASAEGRALAPDAAETADQDGSSDVVQESEEEMEQAREDAVQGNADMDETSDEGKDPAEGSKGGSPGPSRTVANDYFPVAGSLVLHADGAPGLTPEQACRLLIARRLTRSDIAALRWEYYISKEWPNEERAKAGEKPPSGPPAHGFDVKDERAASRYIEEAIATGAGSKVMEEITKRYGPLARQEWDLLQKMQDEEWRRFYLLQREAKRKIEQAEAEQGTKGERWGKDPRQFDPWAEKMKEDLKRAVKTDPFEELEKGYETAQEELRRERQIAANLPAAKRLHQWENDTPWPIKGLQYLGGTLAPFTLSAMELQGTTPEETARIMAEMQDKDVYHPLMNQTRGKLKWEVENMWRVMGDATLAWLLMASPGGTATKGATGGLGKGGAILSRQVLIRPTAKAGVYEWMGLERILVEGAVRTRVIGGVAEEGAEAATKALLKDLAEAGLKVTVQGTYGAKRAPRPSDVPWTWYRGDPVGGLGILEGKDITITSEGLERVRRHLSLPEFLDKGKMIPPNRAMLERLENAFATQKKISGNDAACYLHELMESHMYDSLRSGGLSHEAAYEIAHRQTLEFWQASEWRLYHRSVISRYPSWFENEYFWFNGLKLP